MPVENTLTTSWFYGPPAIIFDISRLIPPVNLRSEGDLGLRLIIGYFDGI
jgi:hypothetical protein